MKSIWAGLLNIGLINIPVKLYSASVEKALRFRLLDKNNLTPVSYLKVGKETDREVKTKDIVRGYEYEKGEYVILRDEDFQRADPEKVKTITITSLVDEQEIDKKLFDKPFYIEPEKGVGKAYALLRDILLEAGKVAIGKVVIKNKEHLAAIKAEDPLLVLYQLRFLDEIVLPEDLYVPVAGNYTPEEWEAALELAGQLVEHFDPSHYEDTYVKELKELIKEKAEGRGEVKKKGEPTGTNMHDLLHALRRSVEHKGKHN